MELGDESPRVSGLASRVDPLQDSCCCSPLIDLCNFRIELMGMNDVVVGGSLGSWAQGFKKCSSWTTPTMWL